MDKLGRVIAVAAGTLLTPDILSELEQMSGSRIQVYVGRQSEIREVLEAKFKDKENAKEPKEEKLTGLGSMLLGD